MVTGLMILVICAVFSVALFWLLRANYRLAQQNHELLAQRDVLHAHVELARSIFARYNTVHLANGTGEGDKKALENARLSVAMATALAETGYRSEGRPVERFIREVSDHLSARDL